MHGQDDILSQVSGQKPKATLTHLDRGCGSKHRGYWPLGKVRTGGYCASFVAMLSLLHSDTNE